MKIAVCPTCRYAISQLEIKYAMFDYLCPRCGKNSISEFCTQATDKSMIQDQLDLLSADQRVEILSNYCKRCGKKIPPECFCMRDD